MSRLNNELKWCVFVLRDRDRKRRNERGNGNDLSAGTDLENSMSNLARLNMSRS